MSDEPIFKSIFGASWDALPPALKKHYANRPYSNDSVRLDGHMDIRFSPLVRFMSPLLKMFGALVPHEGEHVPTTVYSKSDPADGCYRLERHFHFPGRPTYIFRSTFLRIRDNDIIELMRFGIGWRCYYLFDGEKVRLEHIGYYWRVFGRLIPLPLSLLLGKGYAEEVAIDENSFRMRMTITHQLFGQSYEYKGQFVVV